MDEAVLHCTRGLGHLGLGLQRRRRASPDVVLACAGDVPTLETLAAVDLLREHLPDLRVRVVNVVDLMRLQPTASTRTGFATATSTPCSPRDKPVIFAYHGYPWLIHRLTYRRTNHDNIHVRGYKEEGTTTTPFDMVVLNDLDRFHLVMDVIDRVPGLRPHAAELRQRMVDAPAAGTRLHPRARRGPARGRADWTVGRRPHAPPSQAWRRCASWSSTPARAASSWRCSTASDRLRPRRPSTAATARATRTRACARSCGAELADGVDAVGHRVVHGGRASRDPVLIDDDGAPRPRRAGRPRAAAPAGARSPRIEAVGRPLPGRAAGGAASTPRSTHHPRRGRHLRPAARVARTVRTCAGSASTGSPTPTPSTPGGGAGRRDRPSRPGRHLPSRRRRVAGGRRGRPQSVDTTMGFTPARRTGHGDPVRARSIPGCCSGCSSTAASPSADARATCSSTSPGLLGLAGSAGDLRGRARSAGGGDADAELGVDVYVHRLRARDRGDGGGAGRARRAGLHRRRRRARSRRSAPAPPTASGSSASPSTRPQRPPRRDADISGPGAAARPVVATREDLEIARQVRAALAGAGPGR